MVEKIISQAAPQNLHPVETLGNFDPETQLEDAKKQQIPWVTPFKDQVVAYDKDPSVKKDVEAAVGSNPLAEEKNKGIIASTISSIYTWIVNLIFPQKTESVQKKNQPINESEDMATFRHYLQEMKEILQKIKEIKDESQQAEAFHEHLLLRLLQLEAKYKEEMTDNEQQEIVSSFSDKKLLTKERMKLAEEIFERAYQTTFIKGVDTITNVAFFLFSIASLFEGRLGQSYMQALSAIKAVSTGTKSYYDYQEKKQESRNILLNHQIEKNEQKIKQTLTNMKEQINGFYRAHIHLRHSLEAHRNTSINMLR